MNLLAAVAIGFLVLDPEQLLDASFQLSFLAVAFIGAFAVPLIERTSGLRAADLGDPDRDLHLAAGVAQFRIEMRLLAETMQLWTRWPEKICAFAVTYPMRAGLYFYELILTSAMIQIGLALPMAMYFIACRSRNCPPMRSLCHYGTCGAGGIYSRVHQQPARAAGRVAAGAFAIRCGMARTLGAQLARA